MDTIDLKELLNWNVEEIERKVNIEVKKTIDNLVWTKVVAIGDSGTGKTCLIKNFCESRFSPTYHATVGVDYGFKVQEVKGVPLRVHMWDLSGDDHYFEVRKELLDDIDACFLVYDVTSRQSFLNLEKWIHELGKRRPNAAIVLAGNKSDIRTNKNCVPLYEAKKWANERKMKHFDTSAKTGEGVQAMFATILGAVVERNQSQDRPE
uniref:DnaJ homolog subfamily C member 27-like n=1 Tax=Ciona intestinalis TaxID=7719 RepID=H2XK67_CIOIN|nr:dnaJ homolog subfamily C member 27-like isoform X1 [Ciona intestinalis]|eukprot:XP_002128431.1 dnaJ homolog subfamily C member 27-like isoform X1 [Ciona intestinalis]